MRLVAAPTYLERVGAPQSIESLTNHQCLPFVMPSTGRCSPWLFRVDSRGVDWTSPGRFRVFDDFLGVMSLAESGLGICQTYEFIRARSHRAGAFGRGPGSHTRTDTSIIFAPHRRLSPATRALIDYLTRLASNV
ncbi:hypothetical protein I6F07_03695 [Ensifer sp. IC4062]|nr:hypothetical protein [Ensifer sp. IC4062]